MSGLVNYPDSDASSDESDQEKKRAVPGLEHSQSFNSISAQIADLTMGMEHVEATAETFTDEDVDEAIARFQEDLKAGKIIGGDLCAAAAGSASGSSSAAKGSSSVGKSHALRSKQPPPPPKEKADTSKAAGKKPAEPEPEKPKAAGKKPAEPEPEQPKAAGKKLLRMGPDYPCEKPGNPFPCIHTKGNHHPGICKYFNEDTKKRANMPVAVVEPPKRKQPEQEQEQPAGKKKKVDVPAAYAAMQKANEEAASIERQAKKKQKVAKKAMFNTLEAAKGESRASALRKRKMAALKILLAEKAKREAAVEAARLNQEADEEDRQGHFYSQEQAAMSEEEEDDEEME